MGPQSRRYLLMLPAMLGAAACADIAGVDFDHASLQPPADAGTGADAEPEAEAQGPSSQGDRDDGATAIDAAPGSETLAQGMAFPRALAVAGSRVFWVNAGASQGPAADGTVMMVGAEGAAPVQLAQGCAQPSDLAVASGVVYYNCIGTGELRWVLADDPAQAGQLVGAQPEPRNLVVQGEFLYWSTASGAVRRANLTAPVAEDYDAASERPHGLAVVGSTVYWTTAEDRVYRSAGPGTRALLNQGLPTAWGVFANQAEVFISLRGANQIVRMGIDGANPGIVADNQTNTGAVLADDTHVYWTSDRRIMRAPLQGGDPEPIVQDEERVHGLALDAQYIYWTVSVQGGSVRRAGK